jgi:hypothetical protein
MVPQRTHEHSYGPTEVIVELRTGCVDFMSLTEQLWRKHLWLTGVYADEKPNEGQNSFAGPAGNPCARDADHRPTPHDRICPQVLHKEPKMHRLAMTPKCPKE